MSSSSSVNRISRSLRLSRPAVSSPRSSQARVSAQASRREPPMPLQQSSCIRVPKETRERERDSIPLVRRRGLRQTTIPAAAATAAAPSTSSGSSGTSSGNRDETRFDAVALGTICVDIFIPVDEVRRSRETEGELRERRGGKETKRNHSTR